jgi:hypothetical protein
VFSPISSIDFVPDFNALIITKENDSTEESKKAFGFSGLKLPSLFDLYAPNLIKTIA